MSSDADRYIKSPHCAQKRTSTARQRNPISTQLAPPPTPPLSQGAGPNVGTQCALGLPVGHQVRHNVRDVGIALCKPREAPQLWLDPLSAGGGVALAKERQVAPHTARTLVRKLLVRVRDGVRVRVGVGVGVGVRARARAL